MSMSLGNQIYNLCKCGCTEGEHEFYTEMPASEFDEVETKWRRGKCFGRISNRMTLGGQDPAFQPCSCPQYDPIFRLPEGF